MGVFYLIEPFDDEDREWLEAEGSPLPPSRAKKPSRNPTPAEVRQVCDALDGFKVEYNASPKKKIWQAVIDGATAKNRDVFALLEIDKWGGSESRRYKFRFEKGDPELVLRIVHGLAAHTGPLLVVPDSYPPVAVWAEADLKKLARQWK